MCIEDEIESLTEKLNNMVKNLNRDELNKAEVLETSKKLDKLIAEYYLGRYSE